jgi:hypothetical protein
MAVRILIVAARNCTRDDFISAFSLTSAESVKEDNGYHWFILSQWGTDHSKIAEGVDTLNGPVLMMNTSDAMCWNLHIVKKGESPFVYHHDFGWLESYLHTVSGSGLEIYSDGDEDAVDQIIEGWKIYARPLPVDISGKLKSMPPEEAVQFYFHWQQEYLVDGLERFELPHNREEIISIANGDAVSEGEFDSDVGSLPRFLVNLGFGEHFSKWLQNQTSQSEEQCETPDSQEEEIELFNFEQAKKLALLQVKGGRASVPLDQVHNLFRIAWFCDGDVECGFIISMPSEKGGESVFDGVQGLVCKRKDNVIRVSFHESAALLVPICEPLRKPFVELPSGTHLEMVTWGEEWTAGRHRYAGRVENGLWFVDNAYPEVSKDELERALNMFRLIQTDETIFALDQEELEAVLGASKKDVTLVDPPLSSDGLRFVFQDLQREDLVKQIFRLRFGEVWDVQVAAEYDEQEFYDFEKTVAELNALIPKIPATNKLVYRGEYAEFFKVDTSNLEEDLQQAYGDTADLDLGAIVGGIIELVRETEQRAKAAGLELLGDMTVPAKMGDILIRGYKGLHPEVLAAHFIGLAGENTFDFFTRFHDGASLTTTTMPSMVSDEVSKIFYRSSEALDLSSIYQEHLVGIDKHKAQGRVPVPLGKTMTDLAREIDSFLVRKERHATSAFQEVLWDDHEEE